MSHLHVRRSDRELTDPADLDSILERGRYATIAMCDPDGPYAVTLSYGLDAEARALYFHVATDGRKLDALALDPRVCATVVIDGGYEPGACKHHYESVVLTGRMRVVDDAEDARHGMRVLIEHLEQDPVSVWERNRLEDPAPWKRLAIARLDIDGITGKAGS
jgi:nitroimidazol reductase NimA-like FMN-containing flavoprotein (pyridoxamine 5'-phosphate oxidase superfamily)